ncbi:hypothetical protein DMNBHIDG_00848 [Candidatus Methanoperedenaceae archaeon GB37]|nr:hypothetical protein DMNBHIDG_00848 [Candidatus Methanoperedenaceae archaeon GB37]
MLSAPVCRQAGWLNAECKLKNAKSPSVKLERNVSTLELGIRKWELGISIFYFLFLFSVSRFPFLLYARLQSCKLESLQVNTLELGNGNWEFLFSVFYFLNCIL